MSSETPCFKKDLSGIEVDEAIELYGEHLYGNDFVCPHEKCRFGYNCNQNGKLIPMGACALEATRLVGQIYEQNVISNSQADFSSSSAALSANSAAEAIAAQEPTSLTSDSVGMKGTRSLWTPQSPFRGLQR